MTRSIISTLIVAACFSMLMGKGSTLMDIRDCPPNPLDLKPPEMTWTTSSSFIGVRNKNTLIFQKAGGYAYMKCEAPYPIELIYDDDEGKNYRDGTTYRSYRDFYNISTYTFTILKTLYVDSIHIAPYYRCQAVGNPCLQQTAVYTVIPDTNEDMITTTTYDEMYPPADDRLSLTHRENRECEAIFYYEKVKQDFPRYLFRCELNDGRGGTPGTIHMHECQTSVYGCNNLFRNRKQPLQCWKPYVKHQTCQNCTATPYELPFVATCSGKVDGGVQSTKLGSFATFSVRRGSEIPQIYFSHEEVEPTRMIYMEEFSETQDLYSTVEITCTVAKYYASIPIVFGLEYEDDQGVQLLSLPTLSSTLYWRTLKLDLENTTLKRVYCFAGVQRSYEWINASRPIHVIDRRQHEIPRILFGAPPILEGEDVARGTTAVDGFYRSYEFEMNSYNKSIYCQSNGYPRPTITWMKDNRRIQATNGGVLNDTYSWSEIKFPTVNSSVAGTYVCTAENTVGNFFSNIFVNVTAAKSKCKPEELDHVHFDNMKDFLSKFYSMVNHKLDALVGIENRRLHVEETMMENAKKYRRTIH